MLARGLIGVCALMCAAVLWTVSAENTKADVAQPVANFRIESFAIALDPAFIADTQSRRIADLLHAKLIRGGQGGEFVPEIAESWDWIEANTLRFRIRSGLTFSDGSVVTSADAAWSICRLLQPSAPTKWLFDNIKHNELSEENTVNCDGIRSVNADLLDIEVTHERSRLLPALAAVPAAILPMGAAPGEYGVIAGAGPYVIEEIVPNSKVVLSARRGGAINPGFKAVTFKHVPDDATAAALYRDGELDVVEIGNPTIHEIMISGGASRYPGRLIFSEVDQVRVIIFNESAIADKLSLTDVEVRDWVLAFGGQVDVEAIAERFSPFLIPMKTSYFPARNVGARSTAPSITSLPSRPLTIITENDPFSDQIAAAIVEATGGLDLDYIGLEKAVLISRLIEQNYDIASVTLEALVNHPAYWLSFFKPASAFNIFGKPIEGLVGTDNDGSIEHNRILIDDEGNWFVVARERRGAIVHPDIVGVSFHATGLLNYATLQRQD